MSTFTRWRLVVFILFVAHAGLASATEQTTRYNQIHYQVERSRPIDNDRMQAVLGLTAENDSATRLADQINRTMGSAVKTAKAQPGIEVRSGSYRTYPVFEKHKIRRWRATQELMLEGADFAALGQLVGQLQENLQVTSINFSVSAERGAAVEDELIAQALDAFKQRAELVRRQLAAKSYRIVDVSINTGGGQPAPMMRAVTMEMTAKSVTPPAMEAGTSILTVNISGIIELQ